MQRHIEQDEPEEDDMALLMAGQEWSSVTTSGSSQSNEPPAEAVSYTHLTLPTNREV